MKADLIIGIDAGTSVIKAVAFSVEGKQIAVSSVRNRYLTGLDGSATQSMPQTWSDCVQAVRELGLKIPNFSQRVMALSVTGQGDGTWLMDRYGESVCDAWLWLDGRSAPIVDILRSSDTDRLRFQLTGTGLNTCQQGVQLAYMSEHHPSLLAAASTAFHCKDWLYFQLTGIRATDPSEASFTFGDFRTREYDERVIASLGLSDYAHLLPPIVDGSQQTFPLINDAAKQMGLPAGIPVSLAYVDMVMTALGAGVHTGDEGVACSVIGSTGVHMKSVDASDVYENEAGTGYVIVLPIHNRVAQVQTNMASALNLDWLLSVATDLLGEFGCSQSNHELVSKVDSWLTSAMPGQLLYHPYISDAGERGPFINAAARASFTGLTSRHRFPDLVRSVVEGIGMAMRDCYSEMGVLPKEVRLSGGAVKSAALRQILAASVNAKVRMSSRDESGAAGAAMMSAVAIGAFADMESCIKTWVSPLLGEQELPDVPLAKHYNDVFDAFNEERYRLFSTWNKIDALRKLSNERFASYEADHLAPRSALNKTGF
jgi:erythritol kinase (D-erythritol 1-phosphate-forming)